jgi:hypothetical protein
MLCSEHGGELLLPKGLLLLLSLQLEKARAARAQTSKWFKRPSNGRVFKVVGALNGYQYRSTASIRHSRGFAKILASKGAVFQKRIQHPAYLETLGAGDQPTYKAIVIKNILTKYCLITP